MKESRLRHIIREEILLQEISRGSVLYHRSKKELDPGQKIGGSGSSHGEGAHKRKAQAEEEIEEYRQNYARGKPSRYGAAFLSPTPKSRFNKMGDLYKVKLTGNYHIADSRMFDAFQSPWNYGDMTKKDAMVCYWNPESSKNCPDVRDVDPKYLEVIAGEAVVTEKVESDFLTKGDKIRIIQSPAVPVQKGKDGTSSDPQVWRQHPKIERVVKTKDNLMDYVAQVETPSTWRVAYAEPQDTAQQQNTIQRRGETGTNYAYSTYKKIHLQDNQVSPMYGAYNDSIEKLKFEEI